MSKASVVVAIVATILACPAVAADLCNDAHMKQMDKMIAGMTDAAKQKEGNSGSRSIESGHAEGRYRGLHETHGRGPQGRGSVGRRYFVSEVGACDIIGQSSVFSKSLH